MAFNHGPLLLGQVCQASCMDKTCPVFNEFNSHSMLTLSGHSKDLDFNFYTPNCMTGLFFKSHWISCLFFFSRLKTWQLFLPVLKTIILPSFVCIPITSCYSFSLSGPRSFPFVYNTVWPAT